MSPVISRSSTIYLMHSIFEPHLPLTWAQKVSLDTVHYFKPISKSISSSTFFFMHQSSILSPSIKVNNWNTISNSTHESIVDLELLVTNINNSKPLLRSLFYEERWWWIGMIVMILVFPANGVDNIRIGMKIEYERSNFQKWMFWKSKWIWKFLYQIINFGLKNF